MSSFHLPRIPTSLLPESTHLKFFIIAHNLDVDFLLN